MNQEPPRFDGAQREPSTPEPVPAPQPVSVTLPLSAPYVTYALIGITVLIYLLQVLTKALVEIDIPAVFLIKSNELIRSWQVWRLFTSVLLHGSILHVGLNMYALFVLGTGLERYFGHGRFLLLYVIGAFTGNVASLLLTSVSYTLGAGSSIFGLLAAEGVFLFQNRRLFGGQARRAIGNVIFIVALNLFIVGLIPNVDIWGNIGGLLGGLFFAWYAGPVWDMESTPSGFTFVDRRPMREVIIGAVTVLSVFGAVAVWWIVK
jgi:rhomboid protease GluP